MVEDNGLALAPVLVENLRPVIRGDGASWLVVEDAGPWGTFGEFC
jgi:hypothetical protein